MKTKNYFILLFLICEIILRMDNANAFENNEKLNEIYKKAVDEYAILIGITNKQKGEDFCFETLYRASNLMLNPLGNIVMHVNLHEKMIDERDKKTISKSMLEQISIYKNTAYESYKKIQITLKSECTKNKFLNELNIFNTLWNDANNEIEKLEKNILKI